MTIGDVLLLVFAGGAAGAVNAVAGGGSLISFPALMATGLPALDANVTNTVSLWPGYLGGTAAYRRELTGQRGRLTRLSLSAVVGAGVGSAILLVTSDAVFDAVVPALTLAACALLAGQDRISAAVRRRAEARNRDHGDRGVGLHASTFVAGVYGAYFGGGLGVLLLAVLGIFIADHLQRTNALKTALSLVVNSVALVLLGLFGPVAWTSVAVVAPASLVGGYLGGGVARRLSASVLRATVIAFGVAVAIALILT